MPAAEGLVAPSPTTEPGQPALRWSSRAHSIDEVQAELDHIWSAIWDASQQTDSPDRRIAARTSVMNLVVIAGRGEVGERAAAVVHGLTGRHPSRTIIITPADPDGPSWLDAQVQAHCVLPTEDSPETCAELVYLTAGGESGQHLAGLVAPLLVHDLPVTVWWASEPRFSARSTRSLLQMADRVLVDGSSWSPDGLEQLGQLARLPGDFDCQVADFALLRQARWREAIASSFDLPRLAPFLGSIRQMSVDYAARRGTRGATNVVKPVYHLAWLAARLGMAVVEPLRQSDEPWSSYHGLLRSERRRVEIALRPIESDLSGGTTIEVEILAERGHESLRAVVTGQADGVTVATSVNEQPLPDRHYLAPRRREADLLAETIEDAASHPITAEALAMATALIGKPLPGHPQHGGIHADVIPQRGAAAEAA
jgi:glucose-6-phosphate dehydrogenase assembly protein OpcA